MKKVVFLIVSLLPFFVWAQNVNWNKDAGIVKPYQTHVTVSSGKNAGNITDENPKTFWQSENPLPSAWVKRLDLNLLLTDGNFSISPMGEYHQAFDGNQDTKANITQGYLEIRLRNTTEIKLFSVKAFCTDTLFVDCYSQNGIQKTFVFPPSSSYNKIDFKTACRVKLFVFRSASPFDIFEAAALSQHPFEWVVFDMGTAKNTGWIGSRHLNQNVKSIKVYGSNDAKKWKFIISLNPGAISYIDTPLQKEIKIRYIKVVFELPLQDYAKAVLWEFDVYDKYGPYGKPVPAAPSENTWGGTFGINTIWGWGYSVYSDRLPEGAGAAMFNKVAKQLRSYHSLAWDIDSPAVAVNFDKMEKDGTPAKEWLNWDREYENWIKHGFSIDATLMFNNNTFPDVLWTDAYNQAYQYGKAFAKHFVQNKHLVKIIEIGNEPWGYSLPVYKSVLKGMSQGIKSVSGATVLPCAVQAFNKNDDNRNYISLYVSENEAQNIDGLNTHIYPYVFDENGKRKALNPEDRRSQVWSMNNLHRFINANMPGKKVYVTEFGYDSDGGNEPCTHSECVSEFSQAVYGVRMAMLLWRFGAEKLYWYYFANVEYDSFMHNRSGLTSSYKNKFRKKMSFYAFETLFKNISGFRFEKVIAENDDVFAYLLVNRATGKKAVIAWRPTPDNHKEKKPVLLPQISAPKKIIDIFGKSVDIRTSGKGILLSGVPVLMFL